MLLDDLPGSTVRRINNSHRIKTIRKVSIKTCSGASRRRLVHLQKNSFNISDIIQILRILPIFVVLGRMYKEVPCEFKGNLTRRLDRPKDKFE